MWGPLLSLQLEGGRLRYCHSVDKYHSVLHRWEAWMDVQVQVSQNALAFVCVTGTSMFPGHQSFGCCRVRTAELLLPRLCISGLFLMKTFFLNVKIDSKCCCAHPGPVQGRVPIPTVCGISQCLSGNCVLSAHCCAKRRCCSRGAVVLRGPHHLPGWRMKERRSNNKTNF